MNWFIHSLKNYANFSGRANRREWWIFWFFYCLPAVVLIAAQGFLPDPPSEDSTPLMAVGLLIGSILAVVWATALLIPLLAVTIRRFHDIGLSGWWWFFTLIPIVGGIFLLVCTLIGGRSEVNAYGEPSLSWAGQKHRDLAREVSSHLELERKSEEFLNQLSSCLGKDARPESLSPEQKDMVTSFYMRWHPRDCAATKSKEWAEGESFSVKFGAIALAVLIVVAALMALLETVFGKPLPEWVTGASSFIVIPSLIVLCLCIVGLVKSWLASEEFLRGIWINKAKSELLKSYTGDILGQAAHNFYAKKAFPAAKKALRGKRSVDDPNVKQAVLECVKQDTRHNHSSETVRAQSSGSPLPWVALILLVGIAALLFGFARIVAPKLENAEANSKLGNGADGISTETLTATTADPKLENAEANSKLGNDADGVSTETPTATTDDPLLGFSRDPYQTDEELLAKLRKLFSDTPPTKRTRTYVVQSGDTLAGIARLFYGNAGMWQKIQEANLDKLKDPTNATEGMVLVIPDAPNP
jgi:uncharacterized membrane protein YhaH (DUF805 family)/LysM repeat protein